MRLDDLPGLPSELRSWLKEMGIHTCQQLVRAARQGEPFQGLIKAACWPTQEVQAAVRKAGLTQIRGVGPALLEQLSQAGVDSLDSLAALEPEQLQAKLQRITAPGRPPNLAVIEDWIRQARRRAGRQNPPGKQGNCSLGR